LYSVFYDRKRTADLLTAFDKELSPLVHGALLRDTFIIAIHSRKGLVALDIAAWLQASICLLEKLLPVDYAADQPAEVDVVL
jgi:hypothetical protein